MEPVEVQVQGDSVRLRVGSQTLIVRREEAARIAAMLSAAVSGDPAPMRYRNWDPDEDRSLREMVLDGLDSLEIARRTGRSAGAVRSRRQKLGIFDE
jgi:hypothetical protein